MNLHSRALSTASIAVETGSIAATKGHTKAGRDFAAMLVRDHRNVRAQGRNLAASLKATPTPSRELVTKIAPAFVAHRDRAQSLLNEIK